MHELIRSGLEDYLNGRPSREYQAHLQACPGCKQEAQEMLKVSGLFSVLHSDEQIESPNFYSRVARRIEQQQRNASPWSIFFFDPEFVRRVAFACVLMLAVLGSFLLSRESHYTNNPDSPEVIIGQHDTSAPHAESSDRDLMLVTLATYRQ